MLKGIFLPLVYRKFQQTRRLQTLKIRAKIRPMPGNFTARALIKLNFGINVLQSHARCSATLCDDVEFNPCASKRALIRNNFWDE